MPRSPRHRPLVCVHLCCFRVRCGHFGAARAQQRNRALVRHIRSRAVPLSTRTDPLRSHAPQARSPDTALSNITAFTWLLHLGTPQAVPRAPLPKPPPSPSPKISLSLSSLPPPGPPLPSSWSLPSRRAYAGAASIYAIRATTFLPSATITLHIPGSRRQPPAATIATTC
eukprot:6125408-Pleurochrysis_carterae.AAC.1